MKGSRLGLQDVRQTWCNAPTKEGVDGPVKELCVRHVFGASRSDCFASCEADDSGCKVCSVRTCHGQAHAERRANGVGSPSIVGTESHGKAQSRDEQRIVSEALPCHRFRYLFHEWSGVFPTLPAHARQALAKAGELCHVTWLLHQRYSTISKF